MAVRSTWARWCGQAACLMGLGLLHPACWAPAAFTPAGPLQATLAQGYGRCPLHPGRRPSAPPALGYKPLLSRRAEQRATIWGPISWTDNGRKRGDTATCFLVLLNMAVFFYERFPLLGRGGYPLYAWRLQHHGSRFQPFQLVASTFCHSDYRHLAGNLFGLYIFGRAVEEQCGTSGLIVAYLVCGVFANLASLVRLRGHIVSLGASGAVFGLFVAATLAKISPDWRSLVECYVLGQFAWSQLQMEFTGPYRPGVDHTAHIAGAVGGLLAFLIVRRRSRWSRD
uniref:Peptidase S54 rhomboid domain-containing protein n=1 Tax=Alexandrium monilatum TaxID=311494 RepID=A0A7S4R5R1_9DINO|mmetsp:Transcript_72251/g.225295  ORF Transcript_72251/g.225295 Transcript_72251/m.225295 type:complete len:283 (+) Transcript_72251:109-957(+)